MKKLSKKQLEAKVSSFNSQLRNPYLTKSEKNRIRQGITYYIGKLTILDENPHRNTVSV